MRLLPLLALLLITSPAYSQLYQCAGTWTNQPCPGGEIESALPESSRIVSMSEKERLERRYLAMKMSNFDGKNKYNWSSWDYISECDRSTIERCYEILQQLESDYWKYINFRFKLDAEAEDRERLKETEEAVKRTQRSIDSIGHETRQIKQRLYDLSY